MLLPAVLLLVAAEVAAQESDRVEGGDAARADGRAPIGVLLDQALAEAGDWQLSYRFVRTSFDGLLSGTKSVVLANVFSEGFDVAPTSMDAETHLFAVRFAPHERLTLSVVLPYLRFAMRNRNAGGARFTTRSEGVGDVQFHAIVPFTRKGRQRLDVRLGLSAPSGSITQKDTVLTTSGPMRLRLPYPMQPGSGTWDLLPGVTFRDRSGRSSWGLQATGALRIGTNDEGYRRGERFDLSLWGAWDYTEWMTGSLRLAWSDVNNINGDDERISRTLQPTGDPYRQSGARLELGPGFAFALPFLGKASPERRETHRLAVEAAWPLYQSLDGPQLEADWTVTVGLQLGF